MAAPSTAEVEEYDGEDAWEQPDLDDVAGVCPMVSEYATGPVYDGTETVALMGDHVYTCASSPGNVVQVSLVDGSLKHARSWCKGLKSWSNGGALLTNSNQRWANNEVFTSTSWEQSWCSADGTTGVQIRPWRIATEGDTLYAGDVTDGVVARYDLPTGADLGDLTLEGVAAGTGDMSFIQDGAVLVTLDYDGLIHLNDAASGAALGLVDLVGSPDVRGIDCFDGI